MRKVFTLGLLFCFSFGFSQKVKVHGTVTDDKDSAMLGVTVAVKGQTIGTQTDAAGKYELEVDPGNYAFIFSYIGYSTRNMPVVVLVEKDRRLDVKMSEETKEMDIVVVTGSKYEKKLGEEVVSMEVLKASVINQNSARMDEAMNKVPGVNMLGKTIAIRGGSGFSDATGNRVLALLDDMPIISPENGSIHWEMIPIEELEQVEIVKGASAIYGSSAMSGVLNMRTINPKPEAVNKVLINYGFYDQPRQRSWNWWWNRKVIKHNGDTAQHVQLPMFGGGQFLHAKQYGDFGVVVSGAYNQDQGFRQNNDYKRARLNAKLRYTPHKKHNLTVGLNMNFFAESAKDFFASQGVGWGMYLPTEVVITRGRTFNIDPYLNYYDKKDNRHSIKFRLYQNMENSTTGDSTNTTQFFGDYSFLRNFKKADLVLTMGACGYYTISRGKTYGNGTGLYFNTRRSSNAAAYIQAEKKFFHKLTISGGIRLEWSELSDTVIYGRLPLINILAGSSKKHETITSPVIPVARLGVNYQATEGTFIRASIGQGFRFPSMAEKYVHTLRSGADVRPNSSLKPENNWSAELGIKQGVKISKWMAYFDVAGFYSRYYDMIEFQLDTSNHSGIGLPFHAVNITNARIMGVEVSALANGRIFGVPLNFLIGYSYLDPEDLGYNPADPNSVKILKYRIQHSAKADVQTTYKGVMLGISAFYNSFMKNIDAVGVGALKVATDFRKSHNQGDFVMDIRAGYNYKDKFTLNFIVKNLLNREYTLRPALIEAPRNYTFQIGYNF